MRRVVKRRAAKKPAKKPVAPTRRRTPTLGAAELVRRIEVEVPRHGSMVAAFKAGVFPEYRECRQLSADLSHYGISVRGIIRQQRISRELGGEPGKKQAGTVSIGWATPEGAKTYSRRDVLILTSKEPVKKLIRQVAQGRVSASRHPGSALLLEVSKLAKYNTALVAEALGTDLRTVLRWIARPQISARFSAASRAKGAAEKPEFRRELNRRAAEAEKKRNG